MTVIGGKAVVAGAGIGGLAAAAALSPLFDEVVVYEKDRLPVDPQPRKGVAQGSHVHVFLIGGLAELDRLFPGVLNDFLVAGAVPFELGELELFDFGSRRPLRPFGLTLFCLSRPAYEHVVRSRVAMMGNVTFVDGARIERIAFDGARATGLCLKDGGAMVGADFVVDATGRGGALAARLEQEGYGRAPTQAIGIDMSYASALFRLNEKWRGASGAMCVPVPPDKRYGVMLPIEGDRWIVSLAGRCGVEADDNPDGFLAYARQLALPAFSERLIDAEPLGPIRRYRKPSADWRRYERLDRFPERLAPVGDTIASFNPTWGQGMTCAVRHALALADALDGGDLDGAAFARRYLPAAAAASEEAWTGAALIDLAYPEVTGERPPGFEQSLAFMQGLRRLADADPDVHKLQYEVLQMVRPRTVLGQPDLAERVRTALAQASSSMSQ